MNFEMATSKSFNLSQKFMSKCFESREHIMANYYEFGDVISVSFKTTSGWIEVKVDPVLIWTHLVDTMAGLRQIRRMK